jgi:hypothetical protein
LNLYRDNLLELDDPEVGKDGLTPAARAFFGAGLPGVIPIQKVRRRKEKARG